MKLILGLIVFSILFLGAVSIPSVDAVGGKLTIRGESTTIYSNESVYFKGKLTDNEGYAVSFAPVVLWEKAGEWTYITQGKTDARGEYKITIPANHWDYAKTVNIIAYSSQHSAQSSSKSLNIEKPYSYQVKPPTNNYVQSNPSKDIISTNLVLKLKDGVRGDNAIQLNPVLTKSGGQEISSGSIDIYVNNKVISTIAANQWSENISLGSGFFTFTAKFNELYWGGTTYKSSSGKVTYENRDSNIKNSQSTSSSSKTTIKISDNQYKDPSYKIKTKYYDALKKLETGLKLSESTLSELIFENSEANKKIDSAWDMRWTVVTSVNEGKEILRQGESYLKNQQYQKAWNKLHEFDRKLSTANSHILDITQEIKKAKDVEYNYQEKNKICFLMWCDIKDQNKNLDIKIKDLELNVEKIKNSQKDITSKYQSVIQEQKLTTQKTEAKQEQQRLTEENRQTELRATQEQQRLEEQKQRELNNQRILADQEEQRLEEVRKQQQREYEAEIKAQKQSTLQILAQRNPLLKQIMTGEVTFWVEPIPNYVAPGVKDSINKMLDNFEDWNGVRRISSESLADIRITWIQNFNPSVGGQYWQSYVQVGLGQNGCYGEWQPFVAHTVRQILWHEIGHAMGYGHSDDPTNIMRPYGPHYYYKEFDDDIFLKDGAYSWRSFCNDGQYTFNLKSNSDSSGFKFYVITPETDARKFINDNEGKHYPDCTESGNWASYTKTCNVSKGSYLLVYNPRDDGKAINVDVVTQYTGGKKGYTMTWDKNALKESSHYQQYLSSLR